MLAYKHFARNPTCRQRKKIIVPVVDTLNLLMIEAARSFGLAARFASGYLAVPLDDPQEPASGSARGSTHAWAQI